MEQFERELLISRIRSGFLKFRDKENVIYIYQPSLDVEYEANEIYVDIYNMALIENALTDSDAYKTLVDLGLWSDTKQNELDKIVPGHIEYWKVEIFSNYFRSSTKENMRKYLQTANNELLNLLQIRHSFDYFTANGIASLAKNLFILSNSCYYKDGSLVDWDKHNINDVMYHYQTHGLSLSQIREVARTSPWTGMWNAYKKCGIPIFKNDNLTSEQQMLMQWSSLYDSVHESMECPPDSIIEDDDALDGWLIVQKRNRDRGKNERVSESKSKIDNADEIYIVAETPQDVEKVKNLNNPVALGVINSRMKQLRERGLIQQQDFNDVKQDLMMQLNNAHFSTVRNSKNG